MENVPPTDDSLPQRTYRALGPIAAGMLLDAVDLATIGPVGLAGGFLLGGLAGWWLGSLFGLGLRARLVFALLAMLYTGLPGTAVLPLGTLVGAVARFRSPPVVGAPRQGARTVSKPSSAS